MEFFLCWFRQLYLLNVVTISAHISVVCLHKGHNTVDLLYQDILKGMLGAVIIELLLVIVSAVAATRFRLITVNILIFHVKLIIHF